MPHLRTDLLGRLRLPSIAAAFLMATAPAFAQGVADPIPAAAPLPAQIELNLIDLPTTQSLARHHSYFRLTHRFARDLRRGDLGDLASDLFSLDNGAVIGLEYRFAVTGNLQAGVHRSMLSKTIWTFARWDALRQGDSRPLAVSVMASVEGLDNMRLHRQPAVAATVSRTFGDVLAVYATPAFVARTHAVDIITGHQDHDHGTGLEEDEHARHNDTSFLGLGARLRVCGSCYVAGEYTPRLSGYDPNASTWGVAIEKRTGGHTFQLNFTNSFGTTFGQLARGGSPHDVYLGFNITRKF
jgi:hypothetical protein